MQKQSPIIFLACLPSRSKRKIFLQRLSAQIEQAARQSRKRRGRLQVVPQVFASSDEIVQGLQSYANRVVIFHFEGRKNSYDTILATTAKDRDRSLLATLGQEQNLSLVFLNGGATTQYVDDLLAAGVRAVISTSHHLALPQLEEFASHFYATFIHGGSVKEAYSSACQAIGIDEQQNERQYAGLHGDGSIRFWENANPKPRIVGEETGTAIPNSAETQSNTHKPATASGNGKPPKPPGAPPSAPADTSPSSEDPLRPPLGTSAALLRRPQPQAQQTTTASPSPANRKSPTSAPLPFHSPELPEQPYPGFTPYRAKDASIFFGRTADIESLYAKLVDADHDPVILLHGQSGVGKTSLLEAGLLPRVGDQQLVFRLDGTQQEQLLSTLRRDLNVHSPADDLATSWRTWVERTGKPVLVVLDQLEARLAPARYQTPADLHEFLQTMQEIFADAEQRPAGTLVLSVRSSSLRDARSLLRNYSLLTSEQVLPTLDYANIVAVVNGPAQTGPLFNRYRLTIKDDVAKLIADDLLQDSRSAVTPYLQAAITTLWQHAKQANPTAPMFDLALYENQFNSSQLLADFLDHQLRRLGQREPKLLESGLALDVLHFLTGSRGQPITRRADEFVAQYDRHRPRKRLIAHLLDLYLLQAYQEEGKKVYALGHWMLASLIRQRFSMSNVPGIQAQRIFYQVAPSNQSTNIVPFRRNDLAVLKKGREGMRAWSEPEVKQYNSGLNQLRLSDLTLWGLGIMGALSILVIGASLPVTARLTQALPLIDNNVNGIIGQESATPTPPPIALTTEDSPQTNNSAVTDWVALRVILPDVGYHSPIHSLAFSPDATRLVAAHHDGVVRQWDMRTYQQLALLSGHHGPVTTVAFSPDGAYILSAGEDATVQLWDAATSQRIAVLNGHNSAVTSATFTADGKHIVSADKHSTLRIWDVSTGFPLTLPVFGHEGEVTAVAMRFDNQLIASAGVDHTIRLWDKNRQLMLRTLMGHSARLTSVDFSPDGTTILSSSGDSTARLWEVNSGNTIQILQGHTSAINSARFSPNGRLIITVSDDATLKLWDALTGALLTSVSESADRLTAVAFRPDGKFIAAGGWDTTLRLWEVLSTVESIKR